MVRRQIVTSRRNRKQTSLEMPRTGVVPTITSVAPGGAVSEVIITFSVPVIIRGVPPWSTVGITPEAQAQSVVSNTGTTLVLDFGKDVSLLTAISVPASNNEATSHTGQPVPPGNYAV